MLKFLGPAAVAAATVLAATPSHAQTSISIAAARGAGVSQVAIGHWNRIYSRRNTRVVFAPSVFCTQLPCALPAGGDDDILAVYSADGLSYHTVPDTSATSSAYIRQIHPFLRYGAGWMVLLGLGVTVAGAITAGVADAQLPSCPFLATAPATCGDRVPAEAVGVTLAALGFTTVVTFATAYLVSIGNRVVWHSNDTSAIAPLDGVARF